MSYACVNKWHSSPPLSPHRPPLSWSLRRKPSRPHLSTRSRWQASIRGCLLPSTRRFLQLRISLLPSSTRQRCLWSWRTTINRNRRVRAGPRCAARSQRSGHGPEASGRQARPTQAVTREPPSTARAADRP